MRTVQVVLCGVLGALLLLPVGAQAAARPDGKLSVRVTPAKPKTTDTVTVTFRASRLKPDERFQVSFGANDNTACTPGYTIRLPRKKPGSLVRVTFSPNKGLATGRVLSDQSPGNGLNTGSYTRWCAGQADVQVMVVNADDKLRFLATRMVGLAKDPAYPPLTDVPVKLTLAAGSSITVRRAGQPDRTLALIGQLSGGAVDAVTLGTVQRNGDSFFHNLTGDLRLPVIQPDPACIGSSYRSQFSAGAGATLLWKHAGEVTVTLPLDADAAALAGCAAPATPGNTTLTLTGAPGPSGLAVSGTLPGVTLAPGVTADVTVNLVLKFDLDLPVTVPVQ